MITPPAYFDEVRQKAARLWDQLEQDQELAAPWHQLFKQVQSPRHVLSELLQNADDAGATEASVRIKDQQFIFEHNGQDFVEEHFASLCRFGYSNKRSLHTIGFRGIGFKSTFSIGNRVELFTPTLAVYFDRRRFSEPCWHDDPLDTGGQTVIRVTMSSPILEKELAKNLDEWRSSALSLLFFKNIRRLQIGNQTILWHNLGPGPVVNSFWMARDEQKIQRLLLLRSEPLSFPEEALEEIRQERGSGQKDEEDCLSCTVEVVLGFRGRLFVVLPTGVETKLPFACNAPFLQDPARMKIKALETSVTNRWLLEQTGKLAASGMLAWLADRRLSIEERAQAYRLLPSGERYEATLEGDCAARVQEAFASVIEGRPVLLTDAGELSQARQSVIIPGPLFDVWPAGEAVALLDSRRRQPVSRSVELADLGKLVRWQLAEQFDRRKLMEVLQTKQPPKPQTNHQLLNLWEYLAPEINSYNYLLIARKLQIVPVQGKSVLFSGADVVRLNDRKFLRSESDWRFLSKHLLALSHDWTHFIAEQRSIAVKQDDVAMQKLFHSIDTVLNRIGLNGSEDVNGIIAKATESFFAQKSIGIQECVRFAQIAAKLGASVGEFFYFMTRNQRIEPVMKQLMFDEDGRLGDLLPQNVQQERMLHQEYSTAFSETSACSRSEWIDWIQSGRAGVYTFVPLVHIRSNTIYGRHKIESIARERGLKGSLLYPYKTNQFVVEDWDILPDCWRYWEELSKHDDRVWVRIVEGLMRLGGEVWDKVQSARLLQIATTRSEQPITSESLLPQWVVRLRELPCLPDTRGFLHKPGDLMRLTPETEALFGIESFVQERFNKESTETLLNLLGVQSTPTGPDRLLMRLRALSHAPQPLVVEVEKLYNRLDQIIDHCSTADAYKIQMAFQTERLVLTQEGSWTTSTAVFLPFEDGDLPSAALVRSSVCSLMLWRKIGVADRVTSEYVIAWLKKLPSREALSPDDLKRVRAQLARYPVQIWQECGHWLSLAGTWMPVAELRYTLSMQSLVAWSHLDLWVKQQTANLQDCPRHITTVPPFSDLPTLAQQLDQRLDRDYDRSGPVEQKAWLATLGTELCRVVLDSEIETERIRVVARRLSQTVWQGIQNLEFVPYLEGTPAGTPQQTDLAWSGERLFVTPLSKAKLARRVPEELHKAFNHGDIKAALDYSFERAPEDIREYLEANFTLAAPEQTDPGPDSMPIGAASLSDQALRSGEADSGLPANGFRNSVTMGGEEDQTAPEPPDNQMPVQTAPEPPDEQPVGQEQRPPTQRARPVARPAEPSLIARFAAGQGFVKQGERFVHPDGSSLVRRDGAFAWERTTAAGEPVRFYKPFEHCLDHKPLELAAEDWAVLEHSPDRYALILLDSQGHPIEFTGVRLLELRAQDLLTLHFAMYRLKYTHDT